MEFLKKKVATFINKLKKNIFRPSKKDVLVFCLIFVSLCSSMLIGSVSPDSKKEKLAHNLSQIVINNTVKKKYLGVTIENNAPNFVFDPQSNDSMFRKVYGVFRQERATFAVGFNFNKSYQITIDEISCDYNYSIFSVGVASSDKYDNGFKHDPFPIVFMFPLIRDESKPNNCLSISKTDATALLLNKFPERSPDSFTKEEYKQNIIGKVLRFKVNDNPVDYMVQNIYLEKDSNDESYYYHECLEETLSHYVVFSDYFYPKDSSGKNYNQQRMYFFTDFTYQNMFFIDYINDEYSKADYKCSLITNNIKSETVTEEMVLTFRNYNSKSLSSVGEMLLLLFSLITSISSLFLLFFFKTNRNPLSIIISIIILFLPFYIFRIVYLLTNNIMFFSGIGTKINGITILIYLPVLIGSLFIKIPTKEYQTGRCYEEATI